MSYRIIRLGGDYQVAILVSPADATPDTEDAKFYLYRYVFPQGENVPVFDEIDRLSAICYFGGQADGLGWGELPRESFESIDAAALYVQNKQNEWANKCLTEMGIDSDGDEVE